MLPRPIRNQLPALTVGLLSLCASLIAFSYAQQRDLDQAERTVRAHAFRAQTDLTHTFLDTQSALEQLARELAATEGTIQPRVAELAHDLVGDKAHSPIRTLLFIRADDEGRPLGFTAAWPQDFTASPPKLTAQTLAQLAYSAEHGVPTLLDNPLPQWPEPTSRIAVAMAVFMPHLTPAPSRPLGWVAALLDEPAHWPVSHGVTLHGTQMLVYQGPDRRRSQEIGRLSVNIDDAERRAELSEPQLFEIKLRGRTLYAAVRVDPDQAGAPSPQAWIVALAGPAISVLLAGVLAALRVARDHGEALARAMAASKAAAEAQLAESRDRFQEAVRGASDGYWDLRLPGGPLCLSSRFLELLGHEPAELVTVPDALWSFVHSDDYPQARAALENAARAGAGFEIECRLLNARGEYRWHQIRGTTSGGADARRVVGTILDISERREAEQRIRLLNSVVVNSKDAIAVMEPARGGAFGPVMFANAALCGQTNYEPEEIAGRTLDVLFGPSTLAEEIDTLRAALREGRPERAEIELYSKDGQSFWVDLNLFPVRDDDAAITHWVAISRDITVRKFAEAKVQISNELLSEAKAQVERHARELARNNAKLEEARLQAVRASSAKSEFLARMSHEIRTPLNGVIGTIRLLRGTPLTPEQDRFADVCMTSASGLLELINDILDFSKIEAGRMDIERVAFSPSAEVQTSLAMLEPLAAGKGLALHATFDPSVPSSAVGDPLRFRQIVTNLVSNAVKFTERGSVSVTVLAADAEDGSLLRVEVTDTGVGIPPDRIDRLFREFSQVDNSTTRHYGGTGLGLAICRRLATLMGGEIGVRSRPGAGSTFWFTVRALPVGADQDNPQGATAPAALSPEQRARVRVLVAEDNRVNQLVAREVLSRAGYPCEIAEDGETAVNMYIKGRYDLILMDWHMPKLDGCDAARTIRAYEASSGRARVPIIALTANALTGDRERCLEAGMDDYHTKPLEPERLIPAMDRLAAAGAAAPRAPSSPPLDAEDALKRCMGNAELLGEVLAEFRGQLVSDLASLSQDFTPAGEELRRMAHAIKGAAANVSAQKLRTLAASVENLARESAGDLRGPIDALTEEIRRCVEFIDSREPRRGATA